MSTVWTVFRETRTEAESELNYVYRSDLIAVCTSEHHAKEIINSFEYNENHHYTFGPRSLTANSESVYNVVEREFRIFPELVRKP